MAPQESEGGVFIPTSDIYDKLILAIDELHRVAVQMETTRADSADKETRIRSLERWKYGLSVGSVTGAISMIMQLSRSTGK